MIRPLSCSGEGDVVLKDEVLTWVTSHNFWTSSSSTCSFLPSFPFPAFPSPLSREEIQTFSGLLHKEFQIYFLLFHKLLHLEHSFEENSEERGLLWSKVLIGMSTDDRTRSFSEVCDLFNHRVLNSIAE